MHSCRLRQLHSPSALSPRAWTQQCRPCRQSRKPSGECTLSTLLGGAYWWRGSSLAKLSGHPIIQRWQQRCSGVQIPQNILPIAPHCKQRPQPILLVQLTCNKILTCILVLAATGCSRSAHICSRSNVSRGCNSSSSSSGQPCWMHISRPESLRRCST